MRIVSVRGVNMETYHPEFSQWIADAVQHLDFESPADFDEDEWVTKAFDALGWYSMPDYFSCLEVEWDEHESIRDRLIHS